MKQETLKTKAYKIIKEKIIRCDYEPGQFLDERQLIDEIQASRTPIREALNKIEQEQLIQIIPKKGVMVSQITAKHIADVYQVREVLEPCALALYGGRLPKGKLLEFQNVFSLEMNEPTEIYYWDDLFHQFIVGGYQNDYLSTWTLDMRDHCQRIRIMAGKLKNCLLDSQQEHLDIIQWVLLDDYEKGAQALKRHIQLSRMRTMDAFSRCN